MTTANAEATQKKSTKELVADFLDTKPFRNSRIALRAFQALHTDVNVSKGYFYGLFTSFGQKETKKENILKVIKASDGKSAMSTHRKYLKSVEEKEEMICSFAYFLNVWKEHYGLTGPIRQKNRKAKVVKTVKASKEVVAISTMTAKDIIAKVKELTKKSDLESISLKNKAKIVKDATVILNKAGYEIA